MKDSKYNSSVLTPWTIIHVISGIMFAAFTKNLDFKKSLFLFFVIHTIYEIKDIYFEDGQNSLANSIGDQLFAVGGFMIGWKLGMQKSILVSLLLFVLFLSPMFSKNGKWSNGLDIWWSRD